jgi:hypothetical protein
LAPSFPVRDPTCVGVEFLVVLDERLSKDILASPGSRRPVSEPPNFSHIDLDALVDNAELVEQSDDFQSLVNGLYVKSKVVFGEDGARLEPLGNTCLSPLALRLCICPLRPSEKHRKQTDCSDLYVRNWRWWHC